VAGDRGRIVIGATTRIIGLLAVIIVLFHDGVILGLGQVAADQDASVAARAGAQNWMQTQNVQKAYDAAALSVASKGTDVDPATFKVNVPLATVTVTTSRSTSTMLAHHFSWFDSMTHPHATGTASIEPQ
jgi:hypothetical protein